MLRESFNSVPIWLHNAVCKMHFLACSRTYVRVNVCSKCSNHVRGMFAMFVMFACNSIALWHVREHMFEIVRWTYVRRAENPYNVRGLTKIWIYIYTYIYIYIYYLVLEHYRGFQLFEHTFIEQSRTYVHGHAKVRYCCTRAWQTLRTCLEHGFEHFEHTFTRTYVLEHARTCILYMASPWLGKVIMKLSWSWHT